MAASPHVLLVDDGRVDRMVGSWVLSCFNIRVTCVDGPEQALMFLDEENDVDLILTDDWMPHMWSGYDLLRQVKESPKLKDIPVVIVFTDHNDYEYIQMYLDAGADGYVFKPIQFVDVPLIMSCI